MAKKAINGNVDDSSNSAVDTDNDNNVKQCKCAGFKKKQYLILFIVSVVILAGAILLPRYVELDNISFNNIIYNNNDKKTVVGEKNVKSKDTIKRSSSSSSLKNQELVAAKREAAKMVHFIDTLLESNLDDFFTIEQDTVRLRDLIKFNQVHFAPRISSIVKMDLFKFVKFNLKRPCTLWSDVFSCTKIGCNIKFCDRSELPESYLELDGQNVNDESGSCPTSSPKALSELDQTLSKGNVEALNVLFECSRDDSEQSQYYDLVRNPERYTGYDGYQIWKAIYEENCFANSNGNNLFSSLEKRCYEERVFYRTISGLHTSITTHLTAIHHKFNGNFGPNPNEYFKRFYGNSSYLKNLFFIYLIELRALYKSQPYLLDKIKWKVIGGSAEARDAIKNLLSTEKLFKWHFDEKVLFKQGRKSTAEQLASHFHNITFNIIDCVSCDKCRLWGKVQTNALGTAFKILLTKDINQLRLSHHEITCLLNGLARLSFSVSQIEHFRGIFHRNGGGGDGGGNQLHLPLPPPTPSDLSNQLDGENMEDTNNFLNFLH